MFLTNPSFYYAALVSAIGVTSYLTASGIQRVFFPESGDALVVGITLIFGLSTTAFLVIWRRFKLKAGKAGVLVLMLSGLMSLVLMGSQSMERKDVRYENDGKLSRWEGEMADIRWNIHQANQTAVTMANTRQRRNAAIANQTVASMQAEAMLLRGKIERRRDYLEKVGGYATEGMAVTIGAALSPIMNFQDDGEMIRWGLFGVVVVALLFAITADAAVLALAPAEPVVWQKFSESREEQVANQALVSKAAVRSQVMATTCQRLKELEIQAVEQMDADQLDRMIGSPTPAKAARKIGFQFGGQKEAPPKGTPKARRVDTTGGTPGGHQVDTKGVNVSTGNRQFQAGKSDAAIRQVYESGIRGYRTIGRQAAEIMGRPRPISKTYVQRILKREGLA